MTPLLDAHAVTVRRAGRTLVDRVSVAVHGGERIALLGPNGAGKTTLLRCLSGLLAPDTGEVTVDGLPLPRWSRARLARRRAVLRQMGPQGIAFSAREVVEMGRAPHGHRGRRAIVDRLLRQLELAPFGDRRLDRMSGGEQQRVHLARALAQLDGVDRPLLFLDEPTNNLDPRIQTGALSAASAVAARGGGVVAVLHDLVLAAQWADRVVLLRDGAVVEAGLPRDVLTPSTLQRVFQSPMTVLPHPETGRPVALPAVAALSPSPGASP